MNHPSLIHLSASNDTCRLWKEEQREDGTVWSIKFSDDGSLLVVIQEGSLEMWKTSTWERLWSVPYEGNNIGFSPDGLRVVVEDHHENVHAYDVRSGDALGEIDCMPTSTHDHVHMFRGEIGDKWECYECESSLLKNGEYWFTNSDRWLWVVERVARRLIHIPAEYAIHDIKAYSCYVAIGHWSGWLVLDTGRNSEVV